MIGLPGVDAIFMPDVGSLAMRNYWHWGDPDYCRAPDGTEYIVVPITGDDQDPAIAFFSTHPFSFVN